MGTARFADRQLTIFTADSARLSSVPASVHTLRLRVRQFLRERKLWFQL